MSIRVSTRFDQRLHAAAVRGDVEEAVRVLDTGRVHVDCADRDGTTPLILAAANSHVALVKELLEQGAEPNATRHTGTGALFFAAQGGFLDIVTLLLENGAKINQASKDGGTALIVAAQCGHLDVVTELLRRNADPSSAMKDRATAVFVAAQNGHTSVVRTLLNAGAKANVRRLDGASPLWIASQMGHQGVVRLLLSHGVNPDICRHDGATPLFKAAHKGHVEVVHELLPYKPCLGLLRNGESALHAAALYGHVRVLKALVQAGADPSLKNDQGLTPIQIAAQARHPEAVQLLKDAQSKRKEGAQTPPKQTSPGPRSPRLVQSMSGNVVTSGLGSQSSSRGSSRNSSLGTIVETSPVLPRSVSSPSNSRPAQYVSCELSNIVDGGARPRCHGGTGSCTSVAGHNASSNPSPSPSISSEPSQSMITALQKAPRHASHTDVSSVKNIFRRTLASFRRSSIAKRSDKPHEP
ncbi:ankyrin repeat domain-containing protein 29-like [Penaeus japonicus]|uniref:ankyrin repeat domain-containing protein 29-like n=1 Tax=Penaeus japonicus TaxID=27405 RepID=UPI001C7142B2|nr:ankyrin repeat domain-containing protein 29-like [Penaeus japonicus]